MAALGAEGQGKRESWTLDIVLSNSLTSSPKVTKGSILFLSYPPHESHATQKVDNKYSVMEWISLAQITAETNSDIVTVITKAVKLRGGDGRK